MAEKGLPEDADQTGEDRLISQEEPGTISRGWIRWTSVIAVVAALPLIAIAFNQSFALSAPWRSLVPFDNDPGFLWNFRGIDVMVQGVIILAATIAVTSLLREYSMVVDDE